MQVEEQPLDVAIQQRCHHIFKYYYQFMKKLKAVHWYRLLPVYYLPVVSLNYTYYEYYLHKPVYCNYIREILGFRHFVIQIYFYDLQIHLDKIQAVI